MNTNGTMALTKEEFHDLLGPYTMDGREPTKFEKEVLFTMLREHELKHGIGFPMKMKVDGSALFDPTYSPDGDEGQKLEGK